MKNKATQNTKNFWLLKSEPQVFSIDDLQKSKKENWTGVRNYQARNFMRDNMSVGDICFFYHSSCDVPAIVGLCRVSKVNVIDPTQFDKKSEYFDAKNQKYYPPELLKGEMPKSLWICVEVEFVEKFKNPITLLKLRAEKNLQNMKLLQPGSRLSVQPVTGEEFEYINTLISKQK